LFFREKISSRALDGVGMNSIICCADHDEKFFLGISPTTLSLEKTDRGLSYKCLLPDSKKQIINERVNRKEYTGNSFRFAVADDGDSWEKSEDGTYLRTINKFSYIAHLGPVFRPAYKQTDLTLAQRSFEVCVTVKIENEDDSKGEQGEEGEENMNVDNIEKVIERMGYKSIADYKLKNLQRIIKN